VSTSPSFSCSGLNHFITKVGNQYFLFQTVLSIFGSDQHRTLFENFLFIIIIYSELEQDLILLLFHRSINFGIVAA
jgi:uncharacterized membrane protein (DUF373 family)